METIVDSEPSEVYLIISDSLRADTARDHMPFLQSLADDGITVTDAHVPGAGTPSSMPAIMQSRLPIEHGGYGLRLPPDLPTLAETVSDNGVATLGLHSNAYTSADAGFDRGFDDFADLGDFQSDPLSFDDRGDSETTASGSDTADLRAYTREIADTLYLRKIGEMAMEPLKRHHIVESDPRADGKILFKSIQNWWSQRSEKQRFAWLQLMDTHIPYLPPKDQRIAVDGAPETFRKTYDLWKTLTNHPEKLTEDQVSQLYSLYAAEARYVDALLEEFVKGLQARGAWEDTLLVFTADHGELFYDRDVPYDHALKHPNYLCEELTHVPLVFAGGAVSSEPPVDQPTSGIDIAPTIVDAFGHEIPASWRGEVIGSDAHDNRKFITSAIAHTRGSGVSVSEDALHIAVRDKFRALLWWHSRDDLECYNRTPAGDERAFQDDTFDDLIEHARDVTQLFDDVVDSPKAKMGGNVSQRLADLGYIE